ncbi:8-oxo-dGDP phosphatase NUDT18 isoform X2 [Malaclemys terrapin pileata]|uniref:8-oxo-dGDP phosphatase NUDT18 isoform X2 n=1 Tax=Malaclemys terrapin pileata TaxID=2991368 RepID=UPI0023A8BCDC|nr:8-oxo-dGDP phosphatase NUDT18 isoform X2 [Malaclemys terrapin pileata]
MACGALAEELDAMLSGRGWEVQERYDSAPVPAHPVRVRKTACYIVLAVLLNDQNEVLMMQEAKHECYGTWYLPAGRMEPNETILEAMKREVKEETGLECGTLKAPQDADAESLQARWWDRESPALPLRARDILPLMDLAVRYRDSPSHPMTLPEEMPCALICQRLLATFTNGAGDLWVLLSAVGSPHLPVSARTTSPCKIQNSIQAAACRLLKECCLLPQVTVRAHGVLGLQHLGKNAGKSDGVCFNVLLTVTQGGQGTQETPPELNGESFQWWKIEESNLRSRILQRLSSSSVVPIHSY